MADSKFPFQAGCFKEAVCINAGRVYDSCSDKDCFDGLTVFFPEDEQNIIDCSSSIRCKNIQVIDVYMDVEPVPFNKGFYSVDMTFYFLVEIDAYSLPCTTPTCVSGVCSACKKVILYGSEGNVNVFTSQKTCPPTPLNTYPKDSTPTASVQVLNPICLSSTIVDECDRPRYCTMNIPTEIAKNFSGEFKCKPPQKLVLVTLGVFSIVSLERKVQMMVPVYDFSVPEKQCLPTNDDPCELFKHIKFPVNEFFPPKLSEDEEENHCGCED